MKNKLSLDLEQHVEDSSGQGSPQFNLRREREDSSSETFLAGENRAVRRKFKLNLIQ